MEEDLNQIVILMNRFSEKHKCKLELEVYQVRRIDSTEPRYINKLKAVQPERIIAEAE